MNIILEINGGLGKSIAATVFCSKIKKKYPNSKLIVVTHWKDVFLNNPNVDVCLAGGEDSEFYEKYVENQETLFLLRDPYTTHGYNSQREHILSSWCKMIGEEYQGELPELYFTPQELQYYSQFFKSDKPVFIIQANGGSPISKFDKYNWARDIPPNIVQAIIDEHKEEYVVAIIKNQDQLQYNNAVELLDKWRAAAIAMTFSKKRLLIDSSFQHIAAALKLKSTVLWVSTNPDVFGYKIHDNIKANPFNKKQKSTGPYIKFRLEEPIQNMPYQSFNDIFSLKKIKESLAKQ